MKALIAVLLACLSAGVIVIALMLRGPTTAWWASPAPLAVLTGATGLAAALMVPRRWWRV